MAEGPGDIISDAMYRGQEARFRVASRGIQPAKDRISRLQDEGLRLLIESSRLCHDPSGSIYRALQADIVRIDAMIDQEQASIRQARQLAGTAIDAWLAFNDGDSSVGASVAESVLYTTGTERSRTD